jgi:ATP-dependent DNA helicase RecG
VDKPHFDRNGYIWFKNGADKRKVHSKDELRRIFQESGSIHADEMPTRAGIEDIDKDRFKAFFSDVYKTKLPAKKADLARLFENLDLAKRGKLNLAGLLLFGERPQLFKPLFNTKAVAFPGTSIGATEYLDSEDFDGTLQQQFEGAVAFIMRNLRKEQQGQNVNTVGIPEIPRFVFEELFVNALIHRDYLVNGTIRVLVFTDRIEIVSPGALPDNLTVEAIRLGVSVPRNPIIISFIAKGLLPYRGLGSGILRALEGNAKIDFESSQDTLSFKAIVWRKKVKKDNSILGIKSEDQVGTKSGLSRDQVAILTQLIDNKDIKSLLAIVGRSNRTKFRDQVLNPLIEQGLVEMTIPEKPRSSKQMYRLTENGRRRLEG